MTDKELKEKILAEIERLINELGEQRDVNLEDLRDFINSLPEEPVSENLEEAANKYADNADYVYADVSIEDFTVETFKAGAKWQKERMLIKACEFIRTPNIYVVDFNHYGGATTNYEATVEKFKKFMEENK